MLRPHELTREALEAIVDQLQQSLFLDVDDEGQATWDPDKIWNGADICEELAELLAKFDLIPADVTAF